MDQEEISEKIRKAIKAKLTELGSYIDDELPDYIMVMIANKKDVSQMASDLELFLGDSSHTFTQWLDNLLTRLQSVAKSVTISSKSATDHTSKIASDPDTSERVKQPPAEPTLSQSVTSQQTETAMLTLHAQEDDEVVFDDDDDDEPVVPSKPIRAKEIVKPVRRKQEVLEVRPTVQVVEVKPRAVTPEDLLGARKRMISTRGDSAALLPKATVHPSTHSDQPSDSSRRGRRSHDASPKRSPVRRRDSPRRGSPSRRHSPRAERRGSPQRPSASSRLGNRQESRDGRRDYRFRDDRDRRDDPRHRDVDRRDDYRHRDVDRRDDYRPRFLDRSSIRPYDSDRLRRPVWHEDTTDKGSRERSPLQSSGLASKIASAIPQVDLVSDSSEGEESPEKSQDGALASIIQIAERKSSVPEALQANKKLLLRAMADVTKSLGTPSLDVVHIEEQPSTERLPVVQKRRLRVKDRIGTVRPLKPSSRIPASERLYGRHPVRVSHSRSRSRSPSRSRSKLLEKYDEQDLLEMLQLLQEKKRKMRSVRERSRSVEDKKRDSETMLDSESRERSQALEDDQPVERTESPKFVVTLDGAAGMSKILSLSKTLEEDDEFEKSAGANTEDDISLDLNSTFDDTSKVLCRFLPHCKAGDGCTFLHPVCKNLNNCRFGSACKYKHPKTKTVNSVLCMYDGACNRPACPYTHSQSIIRTNTGAALSHLKSGPAASKKSIAKTVCKFHPKCTNMDCQYLHPKPCKYGISCIMRESGCIFSHPPLPTKDKLRWTKSGEATAIV